MRICDQLIEINSSKTKIMRHKLVRLTETKQVYFCFAHFYDCVKYEVKIWCHFKALDRNEVDYICIEEKYPQFKNIVRAGFWT